MNARDKRVQEFLDNMCTCPHGLDWVNPECPQHGDKPKKPKIPLT